MNDAVARMLGRYKLDTTEAYVRALREVLQEIALLGLWRAKFFEEAAFYGGTALRVLHGLDRFSEDLDFSLLQPDANYDLTRYSRALQVELGAFGFEVEVVPKDKEKGTAIRSAFLKADSLRHLVEVRAGDAVLTGIPKGKIVKIKLEIDTMPPPGFDTEAKFLLNPIPFSVRTYSLPDLFAGKMHALLCRRWKTRVKGRDWYDFVWFTANHPELHLAHLRERMIQSGHWPEGEPLTESAFRKNLDEAIGAVDLGGARKEVAPFVADPDSLAAWSPGFFRTVSEKVKIV
jgi:predicted nucleotidyltransferase component of viral defense system